MAVRAWFLVAALIGGSVIGIQTAHPSGLTVSVSRVSGASPFPAEGCGQLDAAFYGAYGSERDPSIAVDPTDPQTIVAAWVQDETLGIVVASSFDGGETWTRSVVPGLTTCTGGPAEHVLHANLAFGGDGRLYLTAEPLGAYFPDPRAALNPIPTLTSTDGGLTWSEPLYLTEIPASNGVDTIDGEPDVPGAAVVAWHELEPVARSYLSRSVDGGQTWTRHPLPSYAPDALPYQRVLAASDGTLHMFVVDGTLRTLPHLLADRGGMPASPAPDQILGYRSHDKGETWQGPTRVASEAIPTWVGAAEGPDGVLTVAGARRSATGEQVLYTTRSYDGGVTWTPPADVTPFVSTFPVLAAGASGGLGVLAFTDAGEGMHQAVFFHSEDGGSSWAEVPVAGPFPALALFSFYQPTVAIPGGFVSVFVRAGADNDGDTDVFVARVTTQD